jgi:RimJ/RimL family protein N-acetyltransferase
MDDWKHLLEFSLNEPEIWKFSLVRVDGEENLKRYIQTTIEAREAKKEYPFIVYNKKTKRYAGSTRFYDIQLPFQTLQLGYTWYGKEFQGTGLNKNCKYLLLEFAFEKMNMLRVEFRADNKNERSKAAMKSIGCVEEGVLRQNVPNGHGGRRDSIILSILADEWRENVKANLAVKAGIKR